MATRVCVLDGGGPTDSENTLNSFLTKCDEDVFGQIGTDMQNTSYDFFCITLSIALPTAQPLSVISNLPLQTSFYTSRKGCIREVLISNNPLYLYRCYRWRNVEGV